MSRIKRLVVAVLLIIAGFEGFAPAEDQVSGESQVVSMKLNDYRIFLRSHLPLDRLFLMGDTGFFLVNYGDIDKFKARGIDFRIIGSESRLNPPLKSGYIGEYHTYAETVSLLHELASRYPDKARVFSIGKSVEGRDLWVIKVSDQAESETAEPKILITGCHHAREWISLEIPLRFAQYLLENYDGNQKVQNAVNGSQIYILPIQNPDGLEYSIHTYRMWRKNRRYNQNLDWGVDTNRNYGFMWGFDDRGSSPYPHDAVYRGPFPFSEPETLAIRDFLTENPPAGALNFHNYSQMILYPWGYTDLPAPDDAEMREIARNMSDRIYRVNGRTYTFGPGSTTIYPTNGDADDWIYGTFGVPSFTIELPPELFIQGGFFTPAELIQSAFDEMCPAMLYFLEYFIGKAEGRNARNRSRGNPFRFH